MKALWCGCLLLFHLGSTKPVVEPDRESPLICVCTTSHCKFTNRTTCHSQYKCYTQYLDKKDGSDPITRGCVQGNTQILCENRRPALATKWPYLVCCNSENLCNSAAIPIPPSWKNSAVNSSTKRPSISTPTLKSHLAQSGGILALDVQQKSHREYHWSVSKPVILVVLFGGLLLLASILTFGFYILRRQSTYLQQLRQQYNRAIEEDTQPSNATDPPQAQVAVTSLQQNRPGTSKSIGI